MSEKLNLVASSEDGNKIYCLYKIDKKIIARGFYDFNRDTFVVTEFYKNKLEPEQTIKSIITSLKEFLLINFDWELKHTNRIIYNIENNKLQNKIKRKKHEQKRKNN